MRDWVEFRRDENSFIAEEFEEAKVRTVHCVPLDRREMTCIRMAAQGETG